jgi:hypothetical protein
MADNINTSGLNAPAAKQPAASLNTTHLYHDASQKREKSLISTKPEALNPTEDFFFKIPDKLRNSMKKEVG